MLNHAQNRTRLLVAATAIFIAGSSLAACSSDSSADPSSEPLRVSASSVPHAEILAEIQELGLLGDVEIKVSEITGDLDPNEILEAGDVDANFFQHVPYEKSWSSEHGVSNLVNVADVHVEPLGIYSDKVDTLDDVPSGSTVALSNNVTNFARGLFLLQQAGLITLDTKPTDPDVDFSQITEKNITDNPKDLEFTQIDPPQLPTTLSDPKVELAIINGNYALEAGLNPAEDALELETATDNPYANVLTTTTDLEKDPRVAKLAEALKSPKIAAWIQENYKGSVLPVNPTS